MRRKRIERNKRTIRNKRMTAMCLTGAFVLAGVYITNPSVGEVNPAVAYAADGQTYYTAGGKAVMGTGGANITIYGNSGQSLVGKKFNIYPLFHAENSKDGESINYTMNTASEQALKNVTAKALSKDGKPVAAADVTEYMVIDYIQSLNTNPVEGTQTEQTLEGSYSLFRYFVEDVRNEMEKLHVKPDVIYVKNTRNDNSIQLTGLDYGYYIIDEITAVEETHSASSLCMVDTANPTADITIKSDYPTVLKKIQEDDESKDITNKDGWNDIADYEIGQTVPYQYESSIPNMNGYDTYYYAWHDRMDEALTFRPESVQVVITGKSAAGQGKKYTLKADEYIIVTQTGNEDTFQIVIPDIKAVIDREFDQINDLGENVYGQSVLVTYNAVLNEKAAKNTGRPGFENDVRLEFSNDADSNGDGSTGYTPWDTVVCFTYKLDTLKINEHQKTLEGAKFRLYSDRDCKNEVYVKAGDDGYIVMNRDSLGGTDHIGGTAPSEAVEMISAKDGTFTIYGLDQGTYYLKETDAPDGYRVLLDPIVLTVTPTYTENRDSYVKGDSMTEKTLQKLEASVHIDTFYHGLTSSEDQKLTTDITDGSMNLTVVNQVGKKLPVTGTSALVIMLGAGAALMTFAVISGRKKKTEDGKDEV